MMKYEKQPLCLVLKKNNPVLQGEPGQPGRSGQKVKTSPVDAGGTFSVINRAGGAPSVGWSHREQLTVMSSVNMHLVCCTE